MADFPPKDLPLKEDVGTLGQLLGEVLREQGGTTLFDNVETARTLARRRRSGDSAAEGELVRHLAGHLSDQGPLLAEETVRAFSAYFGLVNMAERVHRIRRRREYLKPKARPQRGSLRSVLLGFAKRGVPWQEVQALLQRTRVVPVFTAHPTEATRRTLLQSEQRIARALVDRLNPEALLPHEAEATLGRIREDVTITWQTEEHPSLRPTVAEEVEHVVFYLVDVVYRIIPAFYADLEAAAREAYGEQAKLTLAQPLVRFGSWVGGDMDGNPNVGADTITATLARHHALIIERYRDEVHELFRRLSQSRSRVSVGQALEERLRELNERAPAVKEHIPARYDDMPYRVFLAHIDARLAARQEGRENAYGSADELLSDLRLLADSLRERGGAHAGLLRVERLLLRVQTFAFHLATLDVRQDAAVHRRVAGLLLGADGSDFAELSANERLSRLQAALPQAMAAQVARHDPEVARTLEVLSAIGDGRRRYGEQAIGPYIISMAQGPDDALALLYLARVAGLADARDNVPLDIAPLFETVPDLQYAGATLRTLLAHPDYRHHVAARGGEQMVMLGYSDSNKESGLAASRWALQQAQEDLVATADAAGVCLVLFHGRGGTVSRGGSKPRDGILAQPAGSVRGHLRVTEQGEIIHAKFGLRDIALRTLELTSGAVLEHSFAEAASERPNERSREVMGELALASRKAYRALVYERLDFEGYFRQATPIDVIERLTIGSRPSRRGRAGGISSLRAIPWGFAWMQSRHLLPGWYGLGTGLSHAKDRYGLALLRQLNKSWPFFHNLLADAEMVIAKSDMPIASHYAALAGEAGAPVFRLICEEMERTKTLLCEVQEIDEVLDAEPTLQRAIRLRNPYVDPMSLLQVEALARWREGGREDAALERLLFTTVRGIARGMQNTG